MNTGLVPTPRFRWEIDVNLLAQAGMTAATGRN